MSTVVLIGGLINEIGSQPAARDLRRTPATTAAAASVPQRAAHQQEDAVHRQPGEAGRDRLGRTGLTMCPPPGARSSGWNEAWISASDPGTSNAPPAPCAGPDPGFRSW